MDESVENLHIKISGCFNSCGQHHVADLGFYGVSRKVAGYAVPHFQVVLGGEWEHNGGSYGLPVLAIPSKNIPEVVDRLTSRYLADRTKSESFKDFVKRVGKVEMKKTLEDLAKPPANPSDRSFFSDWGDPREYTLGDMGTGECAGEVVSPIEFDLAAAERQLFEAEVAFDSGRGEEAGKKAYLAMLQAARGLVKLEKPQVSDNPDDVVSEFRTRYCDTQKFWDPFAGGKFANYLFDAHRKANEPRTEDSNRYLIDEAQLFIDAAHSCYNKLGTPVNA
jgi:sulfite reductase (ferredoxin)